MADVGKNADIAGATTDKNVSPQKRKAEVQGSTDTSSYKVIKVEPTVPVSGKISISLGKKPEAEVQGSTDTSSYKVIKVEPTVPVSGKISISLGKKPEAKKPAISVNIGGAKKLGVAPIKIALSTQQVKETPPVKTKSEKVASVFNEDSDSEEEEMPIEAKMRMRNVGRETKTAAGPNSFGKGNLGFCDRTKMIERELKKQMEELGEQEDTN